MEADANVGLNLDLDVYLNGLDTASASNDLLESGVGPLSDGMTQCARRTETVTGAIFGTTSQHNMSDLHVSRSLSVSFST